MLLYIKTKLSTATNKIYIKTETLELYMYVLHLNFLLKDSTNEGDTPPFGRSIPMLDLWFFMPATIF